MLNNRVFFLGIAFLGCAVAARGDDTLFGFEGDVLPFPDGGFTFWCGCEPPCSERLANGHFVWQWDGGVDQVNCIKVISNGTGEPPPPTTLWVEWRFRSNQPLEDNGTCDGGFSVNLLDVLDLIFMFGDAAISFDGGTVLRDSLGESRTYRYESIDGVIHRWFVDGVLFVQKSAVGSRQTTYIQMFGKGRCSLKLQQTVNEWDFVRYGTISSGEQIVESTPPVGFIDARTYAPLDRFTVRYDEPNYVLVDEITVETTGGETSIVTKTRRLDNGPPDVVEIVLDRPIPFGETTTFTFDDGVAINVVEFTFAPGDTDGDGDADLRDVAMFQNCFGAAELTGACHALDSSHDAAIDVNDYAEFNAVILGPVVE